MVIEPGSGWMDMIFKKKTKTWNCAAIAFLSHFVFIWLGQRRETEVRRAREKGMTYRKAHRSGLNPWLLQLGPGLCCIQAIHRWCGNPQGESPERSPSQTKIVTNYNWVSMTKSNQELYL